MDIVNVYCRIRTVFLREFKLISVFKDFSWPVQMKLHISTTSITKENKYKISTRHAKDSGGTEVINSLYLFINPFNEI